MASPRESVVEAVSLFPFLSVLVCAMGALIVIISGQSLIAVGSADQIIEISGHVQDKEPVYVECTGDGVVIHPEGVAVALSSLRDSGSPFNRLLDELAATNGKKYLVLLVRPDGIDSYFSSRAMAERRKVAVGKDALLPGGALKFSTSAKPGTDATKEK